MNGNISLTYAEPGVSILYTHYEAVVNPVNCVGVMGKGLSKEFADSNKALLAAYKAICKDPGLNPGDLHIHDTYADNLPKLVGYHHRYVINFPTKSHWREKSKLSYLDLGLVELGNLINHYQIQSIAIPALGCGEGGLNWTNVKQLIESRVYDWELESDLEVMIYPPFVPKAAGGGGEYTIRWTTPIPVPIDPLIW